MACEVLGTPRESGQARREEDSGRDLSTVQGIQLGSPEPGAGGPDPGRQGGGRDTKAPRADDVGQGDAPGKALRGRLPTPPAPASPQKLLDSQADPRPWGQGRKK